jgi:hypothetical protein
MATGKWKYASRQENDSTASGDFFVSRPARSLSRAAALLFLLACMSTAHADVFGEGDRVMVGVGPYVYHRIDNSDHNQWPRLIGVEYETGSHWLGGAAAFKNSYYQNAAFLYAGKRWFIPSVDENLYVKLTAGLVYGYRKPYEDKLPVNHDGFGIGIVPALGYQFGRANVQIQFLGTDAMAITFGYDFWK